MDTRHKKQAMLGLTAAMLIFGTIGIFRRYIALSSGMLSFGRGALGALYLLLWMHGRGRRLPGSMTRRQTGWLTLSGVIMGINWILLFEAYRHTTVAIATLCFYMQPTIVLLLSPLLFGERLSHRKLLCAAATILGMGLVSGIADGGRLPAGNTAGVLLALCAALCYAAVVILNKKTGAEDAEAATCLQLLAATAILLPWLLLTEDLAGLLAVDLRSLLLLLVVGFVHTGFAYALYFSCIAWLPAQSVAIFAYIDPVSALLLSALFLREPLSVWGMLGAALILGAAIVSEALPASRENR